MLRLNLTFILFTCACAAGEVRVRPGTWAQPVIGTSLENFFRINADLYRSEQPTRAEIPDLKKFGIKSILSLRQYHTDPREFQRAGIATFEHRMDAGRVSVADLIAALKLIQSAPKPVLLHCWHGSDRTGFVVAGYRMVFMNWTADQAIDELDKGGFGFHETFYPNIIRTLKTIDVTAVRKAVLASDGAPGARPNRAESK